MDFFLALMVFTFIGIAGSMIIGGFITKRDKTNQKKADKQGFEYGLYYKLKNGEDALCFIQKTKKQADKSLAELRNTEKFNQTTDWNGRVYCFNNNSFMEGIGEEVDRSKFKIIIRSLNYEDNINYPKLDLERGFKPKLIKKKS